MQSNALAVCALLLCQASTYAGNLYVVSYQNTQLLQYGGVSGAFLDNGNPYSPINLASSGLNGPELISFGPDGSLYVTSFNNGKILRFDSSSGALIAIYDTNDPISMPSDATFGPDGKLYVALLTRVVQINPATGSVGGFASIGAPFGIRFGPDGNLYATTGEDDVERYAGPLSTTSPPGTFLGKVAAVTGPNGLTFGPDGNLYVASYATNSIVKITNPASNAPLTTVLTVGTAGAPNDLNAPVGLEFGPDGMLYVASSGTNEILTYDPNTGLFQGAFVPAGLGGLVDPEGVVFGPDYVAPGDMPASYFKLFQN
jgi:sugar lactone lactonase YvrE